MLGMLASPAGRLVTPCIINGRTRPAEVMRLHTQIKTWDVHILRHHLRAKIGVRLQRSGRKAKVGLK